MKNSHDSFRNDFSIFLQTMVEKAHNHSNEVVAHIQVSWNVTIFVVVDFISSDWKKPIFERPEKFNLF